MLAIFGTSLTASHALASLSGIGSIAGMISGEGTTATLVSSPLGMAGTGGDVSSTLFSVVGPLALNVERVLGVGWDGLELSVDDGLFAFQGRRMVDINSLACRPRRMGMLEWSEVPLLSSVGPERARVGRLDLRNKRAKGMPKWGRSEWGGVVWKGGNGST